MSKIPGIQGPDHIQTKQLRIAQLAKERPGLVLTSLAHHIDVHWMYEAYMRTRKGGAKGVDDQTAEEFATNLEDNLKNLVEMLKSGNYKAPPVRRVYLEKSNGKKRPIGIPTFSDKVMQRAVTMILEPLYEQDFYDFSYGFRPGKSAHQALDAISHHLWNSAGGWVVELDITGFFDNIDHKHLRTFLNQRVKDGVLRRAIDKWLRAGVMEDGNIQESKRGTPQGGVISPLLANVYLHELVDKWFIKEVTPRVFGATMFRFADDVVMVFRTKAAAEKVLAVTHKRFVKYGLSLHPEKTRITRFEHPKRGPKDPGTFDFLGFTFYWTKGLNKRWCLKKKTRKGKLSSSLRDISEWCRKHRHAKIAWQHAKLSAKLNGHYAYFGCTGNAPMVRNFFSAVCRIWYKWLTRRSQKKHLSKTKFYKRLSKNPLPSPRIVHRL